MEETKLDILVISDAHLFHKYAIKPEEYTNILVEAGNACNCIIDCGDLTDKSNLTAPQLDALSKIFDNVKVPVYLVAGNHDSLSETTVASIFESNPLVKVIKNKPQVIDGMLFVPYTDDIKGLIKELDALVKEPVKYAFSHLNVTSNIYATLPFRDVNKLHKYAKYWINGHVHQEEENKTVFGEFYNIGACSNLTFGDNHIPNYVIFDTDKNFLHDIAIDNSIVHRCFNVDNLESVYEEIEYATRFYKLRCKFYLPNKQESVEIRKQIKEKLKQNSNVIDVVFDYIKVKEDTKAVQEQKTIENKPKVSLPEQLIRLFEEETETQLQDEIKKEIMKQ